jgi:FtsZ-interacting cell division protein ZipA
MSSVLIIVVVAVVVIVVIGLLLVTMPSARERARLQKRDRELDERRERVVDEHREEAADRERQAEVAEQRARVAATEAERQRAESHVAQEKAKLHERGLADQELIDDDERQRFAGTSAIEPVHDPLSSDSSRQPTTGSRTDPIGPDDTRDAVDDGLHTPVEDRPTEASRTPAYEEGRAAADDPSRVANFEAGRRRERA